MYRSDFPPGRWRKDFELPVVMEKVGNEYGAEDDTGRAVKEIDAASVARAELKSSCNVSQWSEREDRVDARS